MAFDPHNSDEPMQTGHTLMAPDKFLPTDMPSHSPADNLWQAANFPDSEARCKAQNVGARMSVYQEVQFGRDVPDKVKPGKTAREPKKVESGTVNKKEMG